jgi:hypothetical protein
MGQTRKLVHEDGEEEEEEEEDDDDGLMIWRE